MENEGLKNANNYFTIGVFLFVFLILLDQFSKLFIEQPFYNFQFAFSLPVPQPLIYIIYILVLGGIAYYLSRHYRQLSLFSTIAWTFILSGALSNVGERIVLGSVRDFIYINFYHWTGIYNLADFYIIIGIVLLLFKPNKK